MRDLIFYLFIYYSYRRTIIVVAIKQNQLCNKNQTWTAIYYYIYAGVEYLI